MKKQSYFFRNLWLPLLASAAVLCAVSCSKDAVTEEIPVNDETRAVDPYRMVVTSDPQGTGSGNEYYELNTTYRFDATAIAPEGTPISNYSMTMNGFGDPDCEILDQGARYMIVRFKSPGHYTVIASATMGNTSRVGGTVCRVDAPVTDIHGPEVVALGETYDFTFDLLYPQFPAPAIVVSETVFDDPKYTVVSNDGAGHFKLRFDEPGSYRIRGESGNANAPVYCVDLFFRPEMSSSSIGSFIGLGDTAATYSNTINLYDPVTHFLYRRMPQRVYFKFAMLRDGVVVHPGLDVGEVIQTASGDPSARIATKFDSKILRVGDSGMVLMPETDYRVDGIYSGGEIPMGNYWQITIPENRGYKK